MKTTNRQVLPPGLWLVSTPIGNLQDISFRAKQTLESVDLILCEDTRKTSVLLNALGIGRPPFGLERCDSHTEAVRASALAARIRSGVSVALVSDAGTPGVSDPGSLLVASMRNEGISVTLIPGPSALTMLMSGSGFSRLPSTFHGFFPRQTKQQVELLDRIAASQPGSHYWFESPHRIVESLTVLSERMPDSEVMVAKELTKIHEKWFKGKATEVALDVRREIETEGPLGEWGFGLQTAATREAISDLETWKKSLRLCRDLGIPCSQAAKKVSQEFGVPRKQVYDAALAIFNNIS